MTVPVTQLPALVLDFGGPVLLTPFELVEQMPGTTAHDLFHEQGPFDTDARPDDAWRQMQAGLITERDYWAQQAAAWHSSEGTGGEAGVPQMFGALYSPPGPHLVRQQALDLVDDAIAAGHPTAILTNDMRAFHPAEWIEGMDIIGRVDVMVDGSVEGVLKPDPRLYELLSQRLGVGYADMVFIDDQPKNIRGAEDLGIPSVALDVTDPGPAFDRVRELMGLSEVGTHG